MEYRVFSLVPQNHIQNNDCKQKITVLKLGKNQWAVETFYSNTTTITSKSYLVPDLSRSGLKSESCSEQ